MTRKYEFEHKVHFPVPAAVHATQLGSPHDKEQTTVVDAVAAVVWYPVAHVTLLAHVPPETRRYVGLQMVHFPVPALVQVWQLASPHVKHVTTVELVAGANRYPVAQVAVVAQVFVVRSR